MRSRGCSLFFFFRFCLRSPMCKQYRIGSDSCQVNRNISLDFFRNVRVCLRRMASAWRVGIECVQYPYCSRTCDSTQKITALLSLAYVSRETLAHYTAQTTSCDRSVSISISAEHSKNVRTFSHANCTSQCFAKYSHNISRSYLSILIRYNAEYRHHVA